jgi:predicted nucleotidyltransferase
MNQTVKTELDKIVTTLTDTGIVTKIILFGSYARGEETPKSDIELTEQSMKNALKDAQDVLEFTKSKLAEIWGRFHHVPTSAGGVTSILSLSSWISIRYIP